MKADNKKKKIIHSLFSKELTLEKRQEFIELKSVEKEMQKQWEQSVEEPISPKVKQRIWNRIQRKCNGETKGRVHVELNVSSPKMNNESD